MKSANLDFLRATAVLMVVTTHLMEVNGNLSHWVIRLGHAGVMMFFVHTALVLMQSLERLESESPENVALRFYVRRFFRIFPLPALVVLGVTAIAYASPFFVHPFFADYRPKFWQLVSNLTLTQNLTGAKDILIVMWSLPPEVQMYAVLPLFVGLQRIRTNDMILGWAAFLLGLAFIGNGYFFTLLRYVPCFVPGIIAFYLLKKTEPRFPAWAFPLWISTVLVAYVWLAPLLTSLAAFLCLVIGVSIPHFRILTFSPLTNASKMIARYSYGIYLGHTLCIFAAYAFLPSPLRIAGSLVLTAAFSYAAYHLIEAPMIRHGEFKSRKLVGELEDNASFARDASVSI